jgi:hypothetical protein
MLELFRFYSRDDSAILLRMCINDVGSMLDKRSTPEEYVILIMEYCDIFLNQAEDYCGGDNGCVCYACLDIAASGIDGLCGDAETCMEIMANICCCTDDPV